MARDARIGQGVRQVVDPREVVMATMFTRHRDDGRSRGDRGSTAVVTVFQDQQFPRSDIESLTDDLVRLGVRFTLLHVL